MKSHSKPSKKVKRGALVKKAHALIRDIVIARDGECVCPPPKNGHSSIRQAGHLIPSTKGAVRFDLWNVHSQCSSCNGRHVHYSHHYTNWFIQEFGEEKYRRLVDDSEGQGLKSYELEELIKQLNLIKGEQAKMGGQRWPYFTQKEILSGAWSKK